MRYEHDLHGYQRRIAEHILRHPFAMVHADMGLGKQQPVSEPVLTPDGWRPIGDLRPGDYVIGSSGKPVQVLNIYQQGTQPVVRVVMNDGSWTRCGWDHLWRVQTHVQKYRGQPGAVLTTRELVDRGLTLPDGSTRWVVPMVSPVELKGTSLPIDPYTLGVVLGDGTIYESGYTSICTDREILERIGIILRGHATSEYIAYGRLTDKEHNVLKLLGLAGKRSWEKFIPDAFLYTTIENRKALLQGLLDTDGHPMPKGGVEFCSTSEALIDGVIYLVESLGGVARNKTERVTYNGSRAGRPSWRVNVKLPQAVPPFRLSRKWKRWVPPTKYPPSRAIRDVIEDGHEESVCILVDGPDHLYVTRHCIVTHNTVSTLTAIVRLFDQLAIRGVLVVGPKRVVESVWRQEAGLWAHTRGLTFSLITGTPDERLRALYTRSHVYLINYENLPWLWDTLVDRFLRHGRYPPFDMVVWDEVSKLKHARTRQGTARGRVALALQPYMTRRVGLTGTPASNGKLDLFGQYLVVDGGQRLGTSFSEFRKNYFYPEDFNQYRWRILPGADELITERIADITISLRNEDYLDLPPFVTHDIWLDLPGKLQARYQDMERKMFLEFDSGHVLDIENSASLSNRCLQFANGACYVAPGEPAWENIHDIKLEALEDLVEEAAGEPLLVAYQFQHDAQKILKRFPFARMIKSDMPEKEFLETVDLWNRGELPMLIGHPDSIGHGINIQAGGSKLVWYGLTWRLDLYDQMVGRLRRQGQTKPGFIYRLLVRNTLDEVVKMALEMKAADEYGLRKAVEAYRRKHGLDVVMMS